MRAVGALVLGFLAFRKVAVPARLVAVPREPKPPELQREVRAKFSGKVEIHSFAIFLDESKQPVGEWALESLDLDPILDHWEGQIEISVRFHAHDEGTT